ncbi:MAG: PH domain-containing protein [Tannerella sp.]|nr:PH domain-containing protein [Tannerella sp.]
MDIDLDDYQYVILYKKRKVIERNKKYRSRISVFLLGIILAAFISATIQVFKDMIIRDLWILGGVFAFIVFLFSGTRYYISDGRLYIKICMIPSGTVEIKDIESVERSYNPLSSPAASLKRLSIRLGGKSKYPFMLISPVREKEFLEELKAINPDIDVSVPDKKGSWRIQDWDI